MAELSPAAQQVFWAFNKAASGKPDDWHYLPSIAAALRSAAASLKTSTAQGRSEWDFGFIEGVFAAHAELHCIADELESFGK